MREKKDTSFTFDYKVEITCISGEISNISRDNTTDQKLLTQNFREKVCIARLKPIATMCFTLFLTTNTLINRHLLLINSGKFLIDGFKKTNYINRGLLTQIHPFNYYL